MIAQIRAEILKIRSTRTTIGLVLGMLVLVVAITLLSGLLQHASDLENNTENQRQLLGIGGIAGVFSALAGLLLLTSEYRFGTIRPTFLVAPSWSRILVAKIVASIVVGVVFGIVGMGLSYGIGYICLSQRDIPFALDHGDVAWLLLGTIAGTAHLGRDRRRAGRDHPQPDRRGDRPPGLEHSWSRTSSSASSRRSGGTRSSRRRMPCRVRRPTTCSLRPSVVS